MPHSFKVANNMLINRLQKYKVMMGYVEENPEEGAAASLTNKRRQRTASEEERRKQQFANHEAETRKIK